MLVAYFSAYGKEIEADSLTLEKVISQNASSKLTFENTSAIQKVPYRIEIKGMIPSNILKDFNNQSLLLQNKEKTLASLEMAWQKAECERDLLIELCQKYGFFDASITHYVRIEKEGFIIEYHINLGERYRITKKILEGNLNDLPQLSPFYQISKDEFVDFNHIIFEKDTLKTFLKNKGYYFADVQIPVIDIDKSTKQATVKYIYDRTKLAKISDIQISGEKEIPKRFILKHISLKKGDILKQKLAIYSQNDLLNSGLFEDVKIEAEAIPYSSQKDDKYQEAILYINVVPIPSRILGIGAYFSASEGIMASAMWQNKNFMRKAFDVGSIIRGGKKELSTTAFLNIPDIFHYHQNLHSDITLKHLNTIAYEGNKISSTIGIIQRIRFQKHKITFSFLPTLEHGTLKRKESFQHTLAGFLMDIKLDLSNHSLYPTSGMIFDLGCKPYFGKFSQILINTPTSKKRIIDVNKNVKTMIIFTGKARGYLPLLKNETPSMNATVLASFLSLGIIAIKDLDYVPFDKRFYGGGRNSIRSYGYQLCSQLDEEDKPIGETSILEACIEPRFRFSDDWGIVAFWETSCILSKKKNMNAYKKDNILWGCGFGFRYFTRFGPIRFDIGIPFKRRNSHKEEKKKIDKILQFYISIGQSF